MAREKVPGLSNSARSNISPNNQLSLSGAAVSRDPIHTGVYLPGWQNQPNDPIIEIAVAPRLGDQRNEIHFVTTLEPSAMTLLEFVESRFVPEYVACKKLAGRAHFEAMLRHVLKPEQVTRAFHGISETPGRKLKELPGWPYIDSYQLHEVNPESVQRLVAASLEQGYSTQTATHIRNVVRAIFTHAQKTSCYLGRNPAAHVAIPPMRRGELHALTLDQLKELIPLLQFPEQTVALFAILTDMSVVEISGLQWRYVNLLNHRGRADREWLPPMSIAVRTQHYRGQLGRVVESRRRFIPIPRTLADILADLKGRKNFTGPFDFVLVSGRGTPIHPENLAARRLKAIGISLDMPWLSWSVFRRTRAAMRAEYGRHWNKLLDETLSNLSSHTVDL